MNKSDIAKFEQLLKRQRFKKPTALYDKALTNAPTYKPQDVIETVYTQIKAIHIADCSTRMKINHKELNNRNKSDFMAINKLPVYSENPNKFETQCVSGTQLLNIIEKAETLDAPTGMTQEFDTTFAQIEDRNFNNLKNEDKDFTRNVNNNNDTKMFKKIKFLREDTHMTSHNNKIINTSQNEADIFADGNFNSVEQNPIESVEETNNRILIVDSFTECESQFANTASDDTVTFNQNFPNTQAKVKLKNIFESNCPNDMDRDTGQCTQRTPSPVLNMQTTKKNTRNTSPLVVSLEAFENFEHVANLYIEDNDLETAKHLINSQILGRELCLNGNTDVRFNMDRNYSPILDLKSDELQIKSQDLKPQKDNLDNVVSLFNIQNVEKHSDSLKDEILFSSDEETDYINKEVQDLPVTCALEKLNDERDVLEETMYVGFVTASSKSIQICTDSFNKAQSFMEEDDSTLTDFCLSDMVESSNNLNSKIGNNLQIEPLNPAMSANKSEKYALDSKLNTIVKNNLGNYANKRSEVLYEKAQNISDEKKGSTVTTHGNEGISGKQMFKGFTTASCKKIKMSEIALKRCQKVFKDIDLNENFDNNEDSVETKYLLVSESCNDNKNKMGNTNNSGINENNLKTNIKKSEENINDEKINDELLVQEFENVEMSLKERENNTESIHIIGLRSFSFESSQGINTSSEAFAKTKSFYPDELTEQPNSSNTKTSHQTYISLKTTTESTENVIELKTGIPKNIDILAQTLAKNKNSVPSIDKENVEILKTYEHESTVDNISNLGTINKEFVGFKTANNKSINISKEALLNSRNIFKDIDKTNFEIQTAAEMNQLSKIRGFQTAINEDEIPWEANPNKSKNLFEDIDKYNSEMEVIDDIKQPSTSKAVFIGFKTATNKAINISKEALFKSKNLFKDIEIYNAEMETIEYINQPSTSKAVFVGFKTATNKDIKISKEALFKSKKFLNDFEKDNTEIETIEDINQIPTNKAVLIGFKTANDKNIIVSEDALSKTKNIFKDIGERKSKIKANNYVDSPLTSQVCMNMQDDNNKLDIQNSDEPLLFSKNVFKNIDKEIPLPVIGKNKKPSSIGPGTVSNKNVEVSVQALQESKHFFKNIVNIDGFKPEANERVQDNRYVDLSGFKSENNKIVNISEEALVKSKKLIAELDLKNLGSKAQISVEGNKDISDMCIEFQTASRKTIKVSTEALAKSKIILKETDTANDSIPERVPKIYSHTEFGGFQTACGNPVQVSESSLIASKKIFNDMNNDLTEMSKNPLFGFHTASDKNVKVSEKVLAKCKKINDDIDQFPFSKQNNIKYKPGKDISKAFQMAEVEAPTEALTDTALNKTRPFVGFQTANKKTVKVSTEALAKSRQLLDDKETENDINIVNKDSKYDFDNDSERVEVKSPIIKSHGFKTCNNIKIGVCQDALKVSKKLFAQHSIGEITKTNEEVNLNGIFNTQILNNFEETLCTEDFKDTPNENKRPASPILPCGRAKKRKRFEAPYKSETKTAVYFNKATENTKKTANIINFKQDYKKTKQYTLKDLKDLENNENKNIDPYISNVTFDSILNFEFKEARNDLNEGRITIEDIKRFFIDATDKKLIPKGWLDIHLKLILWKLISYEIKFPTTLGKVCTVKNVIDQLKYRYDKELFNSERPVLRKILEKDDVATKCMVLCVAGIYVDGVIVKSAANLTNIELLLTDGWYFVKATIDKMISKLVYDEKILVGCKLMITGAELVNCEQGVAPWEDTSSVRLNISGNSVAPAAWDARLGLRPRPLGPRPLASVHPAGGRVSRLRVLVARVYPMLYVEKLPDGSTVTRSERLEHLYQVKYETEREALIEKIYEEVERDFTNQESQGSESCSEGSNKRKCLDSGSQIAKLMKTSKDPVEFRAQLSTSQMDLLQAHLAKQRDKYLEAIQDKVRERLATRDVIALCRGRIVGLEGTTNVTKGMLSIWKPNDAVLDIFREGAWIEVMNVVPTAMRNSEIQVSAGRQSVFRPVKCKNEENLKPYLELLKRKCYRIKDLSQNPSMTTDYNEIDTVGIIFLIEPPNRLFESIKNQFQNVYLADFDKNMICVNFWGGIKKFGYENVLDTGQVIYCGNLQKRAGNTRKNIPQYRATEFSLFTKTPRNENARGIVDEINKQMFGLDRRKFCEDCLVVKQNYSVIKCFNGNENISPYRFNNSDYNLGKNKIFIDTPVGVKVNVGKSEEFNLTGLDFESTFKQQDTQLSPEKLLRKKKVNEKIAKLKMYGEPPPLSPIVITNKSKNATKSYKSPLITSSDAIPNKISSATSKNNSENVTPKKISDIEHASGGSERLEKAIISMNRTYVKRNVHPVKLNFTDGVATSENINNTVDLFAEEFDGSPPLSLD